MIQIILDARNGLVGMVRLLTFQEDWKSCFDISAQGVARSFGAVLLTLPLYIFIIAAGQYTGLSMAEPGYVVEPINIWVSSLSFLRIWFVFPILAIVITIILNVRHRFAAWLVVHNWAVLFLVLFQTAMFAIFTSGLTNVAGLGFLFMIYRFGRLYVHWRVAHGTLDLPPFQTVAAAGIPVMADLAIIYALSV